MQHHRCTDHDGQGFDNKMNEKENAQVFIY